MNSKLVVALDVFDTDFAIDFSRKVGDEVFAIKINWPLVMVKGASIISDISRYAKVICDLKVADIPNTNSLIAKKVAESGAWGIISHSFVGSDSLEAVVSASGDTKVFSVVSMSHPGSEQFINTKTEELIELSRKAGAYGLIAPANNYGILSNIRKLAPDLKILAPGVGAQGGRASEAVKNGADLFIVGRAIYNSDDPVEAARTINREVSGV